MLGSLRSLGTVCGLVALMTGVALAQDAPITLAVDMRDAPRKILHASETIPVHPGPLTLVYPEWIPGEHGPTGPIDNLVGVIITADGQRVKWERDKVNMFAFHITVPAGATSLDVKLDFLATAAATGFSAGASTSANLALLSWNSVILTPAGKPSGEVKVTPSLILPESWNFGTALDQSSDSPSLQHANQSATFKTVSFEQLVDSPVLMGRYFREIALAPENSPKHYLDLAGDGPEDVLLSQEHIDEFSHLVRETGALYKARHYGSYHFLVTLSDQVAHFGLEHHQSSDDRVPEKEFVEDDQFTLGFDLLPHEFTHSWNGKYRRPAGLATGDFEKPMEGDLLWVYEGLTQYWGDVLAARCGILTPELFRGYLASSAAFLDNRPGRKWRDLQDTATAAQILYGAGGGWDNIRRSVDYYPEGELIWLDVDTKIREVTKNKKSLNDFMQAFYGRNDNTGPKVVPYTFDDVVAGLNGVAAFDWGPFVRARLDSNGPGAPLGGIAGGGYKLVYGDSPNSFDALASSTGFWYSIGLNVNKGGTVTDVMQDGVSYKAGLGPGMKVIAVNGRAFSQPLLRAAIKAKVPVELIVENTGYYKLVSLQYTGGERFPFLERVEGTPDRLDDLLKPLTK